MTEQVKDFVATYKPKQHPKPFFGFLTVDYTEPRKVLEKAVRKPLYIKVGILIAKGYRIDEMAEKLGKTKGSIYSAIKYYNNSRK